MNDLLADPCGVAKEVCDAKCGIAEVPQLVIDFSQLEDLRIRELGASVCEKVASKNHDFRDERFYSFENRQPLFGHRSGKSYGRGLFDESG